MKCPKCKTEIHEMKIEGIDIDFCTSCKGIWYDRDELPFMLELTEEVLGIGRAAPTASATTYPCPRCAQPLQEVRFPGSKDLHVDRCSACQGVWLDKGELKKAEDIAAHIGDPRSKVLLLARYFRKNGYEILGAR